MPSGPRGRRIIGLTSAAALVLAPMGLGPAPHAAAQGPNADPAAPPGSVSAASTVATATWKVNRPADQNGWVYVGDAANVTFIIDGNESAGETATIVVSRAPVDEDTTELVYQHVKRIDVKMTDQPQVIVIPLDTSIPFEGVYNLDYDLITWSCPSAGFTFHVIPPRPVTPPQPPITPTPTPPTTPAPPSVSAPRITLDSSPARAKAGSRVWLAGRVGGNTVARQRVIAQAKTPKGWVKVGEVRADSTGRFILRTARLTTAMRQLRVTAPALRTTSAAKKVKVTAAKRR